MACFLFTWRDGDLSKRPVKLPKASNVLDAVQRYAVSRNTMLCNAALCCAMVRCCACCGASPAWLHLSFDGAPAALCLQPCATVFG